MSIPTYPTFPDEIPLPQQGTWPDSVHVFDTDTVAALRAAEAAGRPLLLRGVPGTGKSQTARAAAAVAKRLFVSVVIDGRTEAQDLQWSYDAVARLSDAHAEGCKAKDAAYYVSPGPLWWVYNWETAEDQWRERSQGEMPEKPADWQQEDGAVLLIDEIDKADPDLPNALLEVLGNQGFSVPLLGQRVVRGSKPPLVVITTNEERDLPNAFLRRCFVHILKPTANLVELGTRHLTRRKLPIFPSVLKRAEGLLREDQKRAAELHTYAPGLAEYLDLVIAVATLAPDEQPQLDLLEDTAQFVLAKDRSLSL